MTSYLRDYDELQRLVERARAERARAIVAGVKAVAGFAVRRTGDVRAWLRKRAAYRALQALDDRTLKDVGLYRGELWRVAEGAGRPAEPVQERAAPARAGDAVANDNPFRPHLSTGTGGRWG